MQSIILCASFQRLPTTSALISRNWRLWARNRSPKEHISRWLSFSRRSVIPFSPNSESLLSFTFSEPEPLIFWDADQLLFDVLATLCGRLEFLPVHVRTLSNWRSLCNRKCLHLAPRAFPWSLVPLSDKWLLCVWIWRQTSLIVRSRDAPVARLNVRIFFVFCCVCKIPVRALPHPSSYFLQTLSFFVSAHQIFGIAPSALRFYCAILLSA